MPDEISANTIKNRDDFRKKCIEIMLNCFTLNLIKTSLEVFNAQFKLINHNFGKRRNTLGGGGKYENKRYV